MSGMPDHNQMSLTPRKVSNQMHIYMTMVIYTENRYVLNFKIHVMNTRP